MSASTIRFRSNNNNWPFNFAKKIYQNIFLLRPVVFFYFSYVLFFFILFRSSCSLLFRPTKKVLSNQLLHTQREDAVNFSLFPVLPMPVPFPLPCVFPYASKCLYWEETKARKKIKVIVPAWSRATFPNSNTIKIK